MHLDVCRKANAVQTLHICGALFSTFYSITLVLRDAGAWGGGSWFEVCGESHARRGRREAHVCTNSQGLSFRKRWLIRKREQTVKRRQRCQTFIHEARRPQKGAWKATMIGRRRFGRPGPALLILRECHLAAHFVPYKVRCQPCRRKPGARIKVSRKGFLPKRLFLRIGARRESGQRFPSLSVPSFAHKLIADFDRHRGTLQEWSR